MKYLRLSSKLEHNLFKNVSKESLFWSYTNWIQTIEYGSNDAIRIKKEASYIDNLLIYTLSYEFKTILMPTKNLLPFNILILCML